MLGLGIHSARFGDTKTGKGNAVADDGRDKSRDALLSSALFQAMKPDEMDAILRMATDRRYRRGQVISLPSSDIAPIRTRPLSTAIIDEPGSSFWKIT